MRGVYLASVWLHILAAMTWTGGMVAFVVLVMPFFRGRPEAERARFLDWFGPRFETVSWICLAVLVLTGAFNLWSRGVQPSDFLRPEWRATTFGQALMWKLGLVVLVTVLSATHARTHSKGQARWLGRSLLFIGLAIVALAVMLVRTI
jgi:putative copper resistance protein D